MDGPVGRGSTVAGWTLIRQLGAGAESQVWLSRRGEQLAALKLQPLPPGAGLAAAADAFIVAARLAQGLRHPAIVAVWELGVDGALGWIAMEPMSGGDLQRHTREPRLLPEFEVGRILQQVALGLAHAHSQGVVHRDLKPANVLVNWVDDGVRIADFGLARALGASRTGTGVVPGTPAYMAPEQLAGAAADARSDLYSLGAMAYELLSGRLPHEASTMGELLRRVVLQAPAAITELRPHVTPALAALVGQLLARQPHDRPPSAAAVAAELARIVPTLAGGRPSR